MRSHHRIMLLVLAVGIAAVVYASNWHIGVSGQAARNHEARASPVGNRSPWRAADSMKDASPHPSPGNGRDAALRAADRARFAEAKACASQANKLGILDLKQQQCASAADGDGAPSECRSLQYEMVTMRKALDESTCATDPIRLQDALTLATANAARSGDADAQLCFIDGGYFPSNKTDADAYGEEAASYVKARLAAGDWRVVQTLATPPESLLHRGQSLASQINIGLPFTAYRATRLLQFGAEGSYLKLLDAHAKALSRDLTPAQVANADEWAKEEFARHFSRSERLYASPSTCGTE